MLVVLACKKRSLIVVTALTAHGDCGLEIELEISRRLNKLFQLVDIFQLSIAIQQQGCVVRGGFVVLMQFFQIFDEIVYALRIQKLERS